MKFLIVSVFIIGLVIYFFTATPSNPKPLQTTKDLYPGSWSTEMNVDISKTLVKNGIRVCGEYRYRKHISENGNYLVYCTPDGKSWHGFQVWTNILEVNSYQVDLPTNF